MLQEGDPAPDFELPNQDGEPTQLSDYEGQRVVLYFYPKANTPGCTTEACGFRDAWSAFEEHDIAVIGISTDPVEEIKQFEQEHDLPFALLSDESGDVAASYETYGTTEMRGQTYEIAFRNTYVVDESGTVAQVYEDVSPEDHAEEIIADID